jgi:8-oxo-dGTP pyrophosphatase MutT (NUDIX family)
LDQHAKETGFQRHVRNCNNAVLPGTRLPFYLNDAHAGWIGPDLARQFGDFPAVQVSADAITLTEPARLYDIARTLSERGLLRFRGEVFDVRARPDGPVLARIDRGAIPYFGIRAAGVHVNGLVQRAGELHMWIARRATDKLLDPGKLDHIAAGGIPAGLGPLETLIKEAAEEAAIPPDLARQAVPVAAFGYATERQEGLRRDWIYAYDLILPADFVPQPVDGEVEAFELWPVGRALEAVRDTGDFKFNVNLVLIDLFIRQGLIAGAEADSLRSGLAGSPI